MKHFTVALVIGLTVYTVLNLYLLRRTGQALTGTGTIRTVALLLIILSALLFPVGHGLEQAFHSRISGFLAVCGSIYLGVLFYGVIAALCFDAARLVNHFIAFLPAEYCRGAARWAWWASAAAIGLTLAIGAMVAAHPRITAYDIAISKKAGDISGLNIVVVSDMHLGTVVGTRMLKKIAGRIKDLSPDIVMFAGDVFDFDVTDEFERRAGSIISGIKAPYGVYAVTGNHEYYGGLSRAVVCLQNAGVVVLQDSVVSVAKAFNLAGRKDRTAERMAGGRRSLADITAGLDPSQPLILLNHQPFHLDEAQKCGVDLQISGHTHHAQLFPLNLLYRWIYEKSWGYLVKGKTQYVVSCGAGTWGPPVRTSSPSEIVTIRVTFRPSPTQ
jgi:predicted MPP superfamily phosphohydrolase